MEPARKARADWPKQTWRKSEDAMATGAGSSDRSEENQPPASPLEELWCCPGVPGGKSSHKSSQGAALKSHRENQITRCTAVLIASNQECSPHIFKLSGRNNRLKYIE
ncbi:hypothetical protein PoB_002348100 [Plakobranchus ocellatus]|uniref:Uncharacterized protein n=1 Tax=Plakobranchus ocellatus TaxID=259542 RepID=A0AAV3ZLZ1_9GAST|nr:hypothetical protein PoB_002348100 [Plakobranchus ocellatus]